MSATSLTRPWAAQHSFSLDQVDAAFPAFDRDASHYEVSALQTVHGFGSAFAVYATAPSAEHGVYSLGSLNSLASHELRGYFDDVQRFAGTAHEDFGKNTPVKTVDNTTSIGNHGNFTNQDVNGLLWGTGWNTDHITFSFPQSASAYGNHYSDSDHPEASFQPLSAAQEDVARFAFGLISQYTGLTFEEITETNHDHATLRLSGSAVPPTSYGNFPDSSDVAGDIWFGNIRNDDPVKAGYVFDTIMHEIGHTLGLKHPFQDLNGHGVFKPEHDSTEYSIMDYHSYIGADFYYRNVDGSGNQSYMVEDISALQYIYGPNFHTNAGDTDYTWDPATGELSINGHGQGPAVTNTVYEAIWDGNGKDTYDLSNYDTDLDVNLNPGEWSTFSADQLAFLDVDNSSVRAPGNIDNSNLFENDPRSLIENATGGSGNDHLTGNIAANVLKGNGGKDTLAGGDGKDKLTGGAAADTETGGGGADTFVFSKASDSTSSKYDKVKDADFKSDHFDVSNGIGHIDNTIGSGDLSKASFDHDLAHKADATHLKANHAVVFTPDGGDLSGQTFLVIDLNGTAGYQANKDLVIDITGAQHLSSIDTGDFI